MFLLHRAACYVVPGFFTVAACLQPDLLIRVIMKCTSVTLEDISYVREWASLQPFETRFGMRPTCTLVEAQVPVFYLQRS